MTRDHADFHVGTGPDARWQGSLADVGGPVELARLGAAGDADTTEVLSAAELSTYEAAVAALLTRQRAAEIGFVAAPGPDGEAGWPWLATTSSGWYGYAFVDGQVRVSAHGGPWFRPDLYRPDGGAGVASGPDADLPIFGDTMPKTATFTWTGFRGLPIPIRATLPPVPPAYLAHRGEVALAVEYVVGRRWPLADLAAPAIREILHGLLRPGPAPGLRVLPADAPFAHERVVTALRFVLDADRYAEGNNPDHARELLESAADVAAQAVTATAPTNRTRGHRADHPNDKVPIMGFTGSLIFARTPDSLLDMDLLAPREAELVGRHDDHWQLAAVTGDFPDIPRLAADLVDATAAPALIAVVDDSDTALLLADSPHGHRWITVLNAPPDSAGRAAVADIRAMTAIAEAAVSWAAEAGHTVATNAVLTALCEADRDNRAADQAFSDALDAGDFAATHEVVRNQISFIEVYVLRVLAALGVAVSVQDTGAWWAHLADKAHTPSRRPGDLPTR